MSPTPQIAFDIYPESRRLHYRVMVWRTRDEMHRHLRANGARPEPNCEAMVQTYKLVRVAAGTGRLAVSPRCGDIHLHLGRLSEEVVSHEVQHAALGWARRVGLGTSPLERDTSAETRLPGSDVSDAEERFCYAVGRLNHQCKEGLRRAGLTVTLTPL